MGQYADALSRLGDPRRLTMSQSRKRRARPKMPMEKLRERKRADTGEEQVFTDDVELPPEALGGKAN